jgi:hypothetical protein
MEIIAQYQRQHNAEVLRLERAEVRWFRRGNHRRYVVGMYSCPYQAGNRLNKFLNSFAFAVITNRTFVWKYCSNQFHCKLHGKLADCERVLHRKSWIPPYTTPHWYQRRPKKIFAGKGILTKRNTPLDDLSYSIVDPGSLETQRLGVVQLSTDKAKGIVRENALSVAQQLFAAGVPFAYGALLDAAFSFAPAVQAPVSENQLLSREKGGISIAIHSRHLWDHVNGSDITAETNCLHRAFQLVVNRTTSSSSPVSCSLTIMTDRKETLPQLAALAHELGCEPEIANHVEDESYRGDHGSFAGIGFFQGKCNELA